MPQWAGTVTVGWIAISRTGVCAGVEHEVFPLECGGGAGGAGEDAVEVRVEGGGADGNVDVVLVGVDGVAAPGDGLAVGFEADAGDVVHGAVGAVGAGNPFGGDEVEGARVDREVDVGVEELARGVGEVCVDLDGRALCVGGEEAGG